MKKNYLKEKFMCKICSKLIHFFLFENHVQNCYKINLSKEELKNINKQILKACETIEKKEKEKFLENLNTSNTINTNKKNKMNTILKKILYNRKSFLRRDSVSSLLLSLNETKSIYEKFSENGLEEKKNEIENKSNNLGDKFESDSDSSSNESKEEYKNFRNKGNKKNLGDKLGSDSDSSSNDSSEKDNNFKNILNKRKEINLGNKFGTDSNSFDSSDSNEENNIFKNVLNNGKEKEKKEIKIIVKSFGKFSSCSSKDKKINMAEITSNINNNLNTKNNFGTKSKFQSDSKSNSENRVKEKKEENKGFQRFISFTNNNNIKKKSSILAEKFDTESKESSKSDYNIKKIDKNQTKTGKLFKRGSSKNNKNNYLNKKTNLGDKFENFSFSESSSEDNENNITELEKKKNKRRITNLGDKFASDDSESSEKEDEISIQKKIQDYDDDVFFNRSIKITKKNTKPFFNNSNSSEENKIYFSQNQKKKKLKKMNSLVPKNLSRFGKMNFNIKSSRGKSSDSEKSSDQINFISPVSKNFGVGSLNFDNKKNESLLENIVSFNFDYKKNNSLLENIGSINNLSFSLNNSLKRVPSLSLKKKLSLTSARNISKNLLKSFLSSNKSKNDKKSIWKKIKKSKTGYKNFIRSDTFINENIISYYLLINDIKIYKSKLLNFPYEDNYINDNHIIGILEQNLQTIDEKPLDDLKKILKLVKERVTLVKNIYNFKSNLVTYNIKSLKKNRIRKFKSFSDFKFAFTSIKPIKIMEDYPKRRCSQGSLKSLQKKKINFEKDISLSDTEYFFQKKEQKIYEKKLEILKLKDFKIIRVLGEGAYGKVYLVKKKKSETLFAMKVIKFKKNINKKFLENLQNEINILSVINGKYLVKAYFSFLENGCLFIIMEYEIGGNMRSYLESWTLLEKEEAQYVTAQLILSVIELHEKKITHRDLKPENILLNEKGQIKIADFGLSEFHKEFEFKNEIEKLEPSLFPKKRKKLLDNIKVNYKKKNSICRKMSQRILKKKQKTNIKIVGTPDYISPEVINGIHITDENKEAIDWWSVGCLLYEFLVGIPPYSGNTVEEIFHNIKYDKIIWPDIGLGKNMMSISAQELICNFLNRDVEKRWGGNIEEIKKHPFFEGLDWDRLLIMKSPLYLDFSDNHQDKSKKKKHSFFVNGETQIIVKNKLNHSLKDSFSLNRIDLLQQNNLKLLNEFKKTLLLKNKT